MTEVPASRPQGDLVELVAQDLDVIETAERRINLLPAVAVANVDGTVIGPADLVVADHNLIADIICFVNLEADSSVDVLEFAVGNRQVAALADHADTGEVQITLAQATQGQVLIDIGEPEGQTGDGQMALVADIQEIAYFGHFDLGLVGIAVFRQAHKEPPAVSAFGLEIPFAGLVKVMGFVFKIVAVVGYDLMTGAGDGSLKADSLLLRIVGFDSGGERGAHDKDKFAPDNSPNVVIGRLGQVFLVDPENDILATLALGLVLDLPPLRILPAPPFTLDVIGIGDLPVRRAGQRQTGDFAVTNFPKTAGIPIDIVIPDLVRIGNLRGDLPVRLLPFPLELLGAGDDRLASAPGRVARQTDRVAGPA